MSTWESAEWHAAHPTWSPITDKESPMNLALIVGVIALIAFRFRVITGSRRT